MRGDGAVNPYSCLKSFHIIENGELSEMVIKSDNYLCLLSFLVSIAFEFVIIKLKVLKPSLNI